MRGKPPADVAADAPLVRALLQEQHPDLAPLPLLDLGDGWDNRVFRLGDDLAVRLPRRVESAALIEHEQRWLPELARRLPLPIPAPVRTGRPGCGFPYRWSVVPWLAGENALLAPPRDVARLGADLGRFLRALHQPAPDGAPDNPWRGVPLAARATLLREHLQLIDGGEDDVALHGLWQRVLAAPPWDGPPMWIHGDLHPGNLIVSDDRLSAVIDFGDLAAGDPATDLAVGWMVLPPPARSIFRQTAREPHRPVDDATWMRARGWALALGLAYVAHATADDPMSALGRATVDAALSDDR